MSRRDLTIYILIAMFTLGGGALISALTAAANPATPYLLWGGLSSVLLGGIGLIVMLFTVPTGLSQGNAGVPAPHRPPLSQNATQVIFMMVGMGGFIAVIGLLALSDYLQRPNASRTPSRVVAPALRGPVTGLKLRDPAFWGSDQTGLIGKDEAASGTIVEIKAERSGQRYTVTLTTQDMPQQVYLVFDDSLYGYSPGDHVYAQCRIERADLQALGLTGCKIISSQDWVGPPSPHP